MTSCEVVRRSIRFEAPPRLPFTGSMGETDFTGDTVALFPDFGRAWWLGGGGRDEWGCEWVVEPGSRDMGQVKNVVLPDLADFARVAVPDALDPQRYRHWEPILDRAAREGRYVVLCNGPFLFERVHFLHGFAETLMDSLEQPERMQAFLRHLARYHLDTIRYVREHFNGRIHGYRGTDDWGTQTAPLVSPAVFNTVFKPVYAAIFGAIHDAGMDVWMHACGEVLELLDAFIDAGLDVANLLQPSIFPVPRLGAWRGRLCFEMVADMQSTLPRGDRDALRREIAAIVEACCAPDGGLIAMRVDRMFTEADGIDPALAGFCAATYRQLDPWRAKESNR